MTLNWTCFSQTESLIISSLVTNVNCLPPFVLNKSKQILNTQYCDNVSENANSVSETVTLHMKASNRWCTFLQKIQHQQTSVRSYSQILVCSCVNLDSSPRSWRVSCSWIQSSAGRGQWWPVQTSHSSLNLSWTNDSLCNLLKNIRYRRSKRNNH